MSKSNRLIYWIPRILSILFILFLSLFSLDVIIPKASFWEILGGLLIHNIPSFILIVILVISWKYEIVGAISFILIGILYILNVLITIIRTSPFEWHYLITIMIISGPAFLIGILFLVDWLKKA